MVFVHYPEYISLKDMKYKDFKVFARELKEIHNSSIIIFHPSLGDLICADEFDEELTRYIKKTFGEFCELRLFSKGFYLISTPLPSSGVSSYIFPE